MYGIGKHHTLIHGLTTFWHLVRGGGIDSQTKNFELRLPDIRRGRALKNRATLWKRKVGVQDFGKYQHGLELFLTFLANNWIFLRYLQGDDRIGVLACSSPITSQEDVDQRSWC